MISIRRDDRVAVTSDNGTASNRETDGISAADAAAPFCDPCRANCGRRRPPQFRSDITMMDANDVSASHPQAISKGHRIVSAVLPAFLIGLTAFLTVVDLFATQA